MGGTRGCISIVAGSRFLIVASLFPLQMTRGVRTPPEVALIVIRMKALGKPTKEITRLMGVPMRTVRHIIHFYRTTGEYGMKERSRRHYKMSAEDVEVSGTHIITSNTD
jgi:hypothetical protein